uniref:Uncharacterized protein n=1 Tax=Corvus moneduloides TaxID=1196302 RepID=A0A8U7MDU9_CORMO
MAVPVSPSQERGTMLKFNSQDFKDLKALCLSQGLLFEDATFPAHISSIGPNLLPEEKLWQIQWKRPTRGGLGTAAARLWPAWMLKHMDPRREAEQPAELLNVDACVERWEGSTAQGVVGVEMLGADIWVSSVKVP